MAARRKKKSPGLRDASNSRKGTKGSSSAPPAPETPVSEPAVVETPVADTDEAGAPAEVDLPIAPDADLSQSADFLKMITGKVPGRRRYYPACLFFT